MIYTVTPEHKGERLDAYLARVAQLSRSRIQALIEEGAVLVGGRTADKKQSVAVGDVITLTLPEPVEVAVLAENIPLDIVYEDEDILVVNKQKGMVVHPAPGNASGTLVNALLYHCKSSLSGINGELRPGIVHRIDKDTSGLLVVAKNDAAHLSLARQLETHAMYREYHAIVNGGFREDTGTVNAPIGRHPVDRKKMAVIRDGSHTAREAITHYTVLERFGGVSYLRLRLETGRTHQIRVHMASLGHPLLGDTVYGGGNTRFEKVHAALLDGQALHARALTLTHPRTGEEMRFECPFPENFFKLLEILRNTV